MTHDTDPDDAAERANRNPDDASTADIEAVLRGQQLFTHLQRIDGCRRCQEMNTKRGYAGVDRVDETFQDGDEVTVHAVHADADAHFAGPFWRITAVDHRRHPQLPFEDTVQSGTDIVRAHARVHDVSGQQHLLDVDVVERSPKDDGPQQSRVDKREQQHIVEGDGDVHPQGMEVIENDPDEPPAHWPDEDRQWLQKLVDERGPLEVPTYSIEEPHTDDVNPRGDGLR